MKKIHGRSNIETVNYYGQRLGGDTNGLCQIAEFRHIKAMALQIRDGKGVRGVKLYDNNRRQVIAQGLRIQLYDKNTIHLLTGEVKNVLAIEEIGKKNPKLRLRTGFPNRQNFLIYNNREIDFGHPNNEVIAWAFSHFAINYSYEELFNILVPLVYETTFDVKIH